MDLWCGTNHGDCNKKNEKGYIFHRFDCFVGISSIVKSKKLFDLVPLFRLISWSSFCLVKSSYFAIFVSIYFNL